MADNESYTTDTLAETIRVVSEVLQLGERADALSPKSRLLGAMPEFDSMAVVALITALEERYDFEVADDEIDAAVFESIGSLHKFVEQKLHQ